MKIHYMYLKNVKCSSVITNEECKTLANNRLLLLFSYSQQKLQLALVVTTGGIVSSTTVVTGCHYASRAQKQ